MALVALRPNHDTLRLVEALGGKWHGVSAMCRCPVHADHMPSLSIRQGERGLLVTCFAGCDAAAVLRGLRGIEPGKLPPTMPREPAPQRMNSAEAARRFWDQGLPIAGMPAEEYLTSRYLNTNLANIRFNPTCPFGRKPDTVFVPALLVAACDNSRLCGIQRIMLAADGTAGTKRHSVYWEQQHSGRSRTIRRYWRLRGVCQRGSPNCAYRHYLLGQLRRTPAAAARSAKNGSQTRHCRRQRCLRAPCRHEGLQAYCRPDLLIVHDRPRQAGYDWADVEKREERCATVMR